MIIIEVLIDVAKKQSQNELLKSIAPWKEKSA